MNEILDQIKELCAGLSVDEVEAQILASENADSVTDARALAVYFVSLAGGETEGEPADED